MNKPDRLFLSMLRLGVMQAAVCVSQRARQEVLKGVQYNPNLITNQLTRFDMVTDSMMQFPGDLHFPKGKGWREADFMSLDGLSKDYFGYENMLVVSQGRMAELILASTLVKPKQFVLHNLLFPTTRLHPEVAGAQLVAIPVEEAYDLQSGFAFKGNVNIEAFKRFVREHGATSISYVMIETSVNATGGHPVSMENIREVYRFAKSEGILVFLDSTRIRENAWLIRMREAGYFEKSIEAIVREFCSYSDGCAMSATKDFPVDCGGFLATRRLDLHLRFQDLQFLVGDGLSVDSKAKLYSGMERSIRNESSLIRRIQNAEHLGTLLKAAQVPVVTPLSGYAVFIDTRSLLPIVPADQFPELAFLNKLYLECGILGIEGMLTEEQKNKGIRMIRLAIPLGHFNRRQIARIAREVIQVWNRRYELRGLKLLSRPDCKTGDYLAKYAPL